MCCVAEEILFSYFFLFEAAVTQQHTELLLRAAVTQQHTELLIVLHGAAMEGAVLLDDGTTVDADDLAVGIGLANDTEGLGVEVGLGIGGHQDGAIDDQVVGVGGGETVTVSDGIADQTTFGHGRIIDRTGEGELQKAVGTAFEGTECTELFFHQGQVGMVGIATGKDDGVVRADAYQGIDMAIGIIANEAAVVEPYNALGTEIFLEAGFNLGLREGLVAMRRHEATRSGEDGAFAIALDRTALEDEVEVGLVLALNDALVVEVLVDLIIQIGLELLTPAVELEIEKDDVRGLMSDV